VRYLSVRLAPWRVTLFTESDTAVMQFEENFDLGTARPRFHRRDLGSAERRRLR
jgi:hypothetical protein